MRVWVWAGDCWPQASFGLVFTIASSLAFIAPLMFGLAMDRFGPRVSTTAGMAISLTGSVLVAASDPAGGFQAYLPGFACVGLASSGVMMGLLHVRYAHAALLVHCEDSDTNCWLGASGHTATCSLGASTPY